MGTLRDVHFVASASVRGRAEVVELLEILRQKRYAWVEKREIRPRSVGSTRK